jgi:hypothetical protein
MLVCAFLLGRERKIGGRTSKGNEGGTYTRAQRGREDNFLSVVYNAARIHRDKDEKNLGKTVKEIPQPRCLLFWEFI